MTTNSGAAVSLLSIRDLQVWSGAGSEATPVLRGVDLDVRAGEAIGVVGESGSGKSMTLRAIMRQLPAGFSASGSVAFRGEEVSQMRSRRLARLRAGTPARGVGRHGTSNRCVA